MPDTGAPWNIPYVAGTDLVADWPTDSQTLATAIANGLDNVPIEVRQIVAATDTVDRSTSSTSFVTATISVTITPTAADSKIIVIWSGYLLNSSGTSEFAIAKVRITDGSTPLSGAEDSGFERKAGSVSGAYHGYSGPLAIGWYDVSSTSAITFEGDFKTGGGTAYLYNSTNQTGRMIAIEIAP